MVPGAAPSAVGVPESSGLQSLNQFPGKGGAERQRHGDGEYCPEDRRAQRCTGCDQRRRGGGADSAGEGTEGSGELPWFTDEAKGQVEGIPKSSGDQHQIRNPRPPRDHGGGRHEEGVGFQIEHAAMVGRSLAPGKPPVQQVSQVAHDKTRGENPGMDLQHRGDADRAVENRPSRRYEIGPPSRSRKKTEDGKDQGRSQGENDEPRLDETEG